MEEGFLHGCVPWGRPAHHHGQFQLHWKAQNILRYAPTFPDLPGKITAIKWNPLFSPDIIYKRLPHPSPSLPLQWRSCPSSFKDHAAFLALVLFCLLIQCIAFICLLTILIYLSYYLSLSYIFNLSLSSRTFFFKYFILFYLFMAALGLRCCTRAFSSCGGQGLLFVAVHRLLIAVASFLAEHGL